MLTSLTTKKKWKKFPEIYNLPRQNHDEIENQNKWMTNKEIE